MFTISGLHLAFSFSSVIQKLVLRIFPFRYMIFDDLFNALFQGVRVELGVDVQVIPHWESVALFEYLLRQGFVTLNAFIHVHLESAKHDRYETASAGSSNEIKDLARLCRR